MNRSESRDERGPELPPLPHALIDPRPALAVGTIAWTVAALALMLADAPSRQIALCFAGIGVGFAGSVVYVLQRRAVQRGAAGAQDGLAD